MRLLVCGRKYREEPYFFPSLLVLLWVFFFFLSYFCFVLFACLCEQRGIVAAARAFYTLFVDSLVESGTASTILFCKTFKYRSP